MDMEIGENGRKHHCSHTMVLFTNIFVFFLLLYVCSSVYVFFVWFQLPYNILLTKKKNFKLQRNLNILHSFPIFEISKYKISIAAD